VAPLCEDVGLGDQLVSQQSISDSGVDDDVSSSVSSDYSDFDPLADGTETVECGSLEAAVPLPGATYYKYMKDYVDYRDHEAEAVLSTASNLLNVTWNDRANAPDKDACLSLGAKNEVNYLHFAGGRLVTSTLPVHSTYMVGVDVVTRDIVPIKSRVDKETGRKTMRVPVSVHTLFVFDKFEVYVSQELADKCRPLVARDKAPNSHVTLFEGVAGAGKTYNIISTYALGDLVLSNSVATKDEILKELSGKYGEDKVKPYVRTLHSYIMRPNLKSAKLFVDEALMAHGGEIFAAMVFSGATTVRLYGDRTQIPFLNRICDFKLSTGCFDAFDEIEYNHVSRRCPVDVCAALYENYDRKILTTSNVTSSMNVHYISSVKSVKKRDDCKYLVFCQSEKQALEDLGIKPVQISKVSDFKDFGTHSSVHEAQGKTFKRVALVRTKPREHDIFNSHPHCVVAISRHTERFDYYTVGRQDGITRMVAAGARKEIQRLVKKEE
jgi:hypothetical protein